jgi:serine protease Do
MKKIFFLAICVGMFSAVTHTATAQEDKKENKPEEIIIRKHGDTDTRMTIEIKGDDILINGKPLSEFKDSTLTVMKRNELMRHGNDMLIRPRGENSFYYNNDNEEEPRPFLGVTTEKNDNGAKISTISKGSAAEKAGLKEGDIITKIGDKKIADPEDLVDAVKSYKPRNEVKIYYQRNGKANDTKAIL